MVSGHRLHVGDLPPLAAGVGEDAGAPCGVEVPVKCAEGSILRDEGEGRSVGACRHGGSPDVRGHRLGGEVGGREEVDGGIGGIGLGRILRRGLGGASGGRDRVPPESLLAVGVRDHEAGSSLHERVEPGGLLGEGPGVEHRARGVEQAGRSEVDQAGAVARHDERSLLGLSAQQGPRAVDAVDSDLGELLTGIGCGEVLLVQRGHDGSIEHGLSEVDGPGQARGCGTQQVGDGQGVGLAEVLILRVVLHEEIPDAHQTCDR